MLDSLITGVLIGFGLAFVVIVLLIVGAIKKHKDNLRKRSNL